MTDSNDVQALEKISTEVNESQLNIVLSIQCIKAQSYLVNKLHKQSEQQKQKCNFISNGNLKLETEIRLAEQEVKSLLIALETIKAANVELRKELLLAKERTIDTTERVNSGIKKYEQLWLTSKQRYENIPFIKKYLQIVNEKDTLHDNITKLANEKQKLLNDINKRKYELLCADKKNIIELAKYMVHERPVTLANIKNKQDELNILIKEIQDITNSNDSVSLLKVDLTVDKYASNSTNNIKDSWLNMSTTVDNKRGAMPKLQMRSIDLDFFSHKLDKIKKIDSQKIFTKRIDSEPLDNQPKKIKTEEMVKDVYMSSYFPKNNEDSNDLKSNFSGKKLIHILEDIKLDKTETYEIIAKVNCSALQIVDKIGENAQEIISLEHDKNPGEDKEKIEEIDMTNSLIASSSSVLVPPSQFLDFTQNKCINSQGQIDAEKKLTKSSQEKKVKFNEVMSVKSADIIDLGKSIDDDNNQFDVSATSDDSYKKIKEIVFKKHNLVLSPEFTYTKNSVTAMGTENGVKSKFFDEKNKIQAMDVDEEPTNDNKVESSQKICDDDIAPETVNENKDDDCKDTSMPGFLFTHGPRGIVDSLDVSVSALGYEDTDLPPCIDSNLLLSPKADDQMPATSGSVQVLSQEVPNFLSGLKKTGLSFFGNQQSEDKANQNQSNNFTFAFGGDGKKSRGGFFSMFH